MKPLDPLNSQLNKFPYLYRIELLDRFFQLLDNKELVFVKPSCWTDPMENIIFNARILKGDTEYVHPAKDKIYAQCWSYDDDSYALWQIYTTKPNDSGITKRHAGIRITTHLDKLAHLADMNQGIFHYGLVKYLPKKDLEKLPNDPDFTACLASEELHDDHFRSLLIKRKSYKYEREVRLMYHPKENNSDRIYRLKIEPHKFITSLRLDPSLTKQEAARLKEQLIYQYGFKSSQVTQSTLNTNNKLIFRI